MEQKIIKNKPVEAFLSYLEVERGRSANTIDNYRFYLTRFFDWVHSSLKLRTAGRFIKPEQINLPLIRQYRIYLNRLSTIDGEPLKKSTQNYHLIALRSFLKFLSKQDVKSLAPEKIELAKMPERMVNFLGEDEIDRLLDAPLPSSPFQGGSKGGSGVKLGDLRDKAILEILFSTGLRVSELCHLKRDDISLKKKKGAIEFSVRGKGKKVRVVFLSEQAAFWLKEYLDRRIDVSPWMFVRMDKAAASLAKRDEEPMTPRSMQRMVAKYATIAGIAKQITPHTLRHSFATDLLSNDADIRTVQAMLGHSSITTTQVYTHITDKHLREAHNRCHNRKIRK
ncbi:tyrosine-type recombinase/integrase [Candidatus Parcubacteria bacterium]|nr:tyrosine-type recombinase/integrase [Patescibacteria group bacterium]MCG2693944.1 tyrosine-type recombinase/integrase [Candidatus Parcubacteria bacterium]